MKKRRAVLKKRWTMLLILIAVLGATILYFLSDRLYFSAKVTEPLSQISTSGLPSCMVGFTPDKQCSGEFKPLSTVSELSELKCTQPAPFELTLSIDSSGIADFEVHLPEADCKGSDSDKSLFKGLQKNRVKSSRNNICREQASIFKNPAYLELSLTEGVKFSGKINEKKVRGSSQNLYNGFEFNLNVFEIPSHEDNLIFEGKTFSFDLSSTPRPCQPIPVENLGSTFNVQTTRDGIKLPAILEKDPETGEIRRIRLLQEEEEIRERLDALNRGEAIFSKTTLMGGNEWGVGYATLDRIIPGRARWPSSEAHLLYIETTPENLGRFIIKINNNIIQPTYETVKDFCSGAVGEAAAICEDYLE